MALQQNPGFMAALGMNVDKEQILTDNRKRKEAEALGLVEGLGFAPGTQAAANAGAILGSRLSGTPGLTPDQQRKYDAAQATQARMDEWLKTNDKASMGEREDKWMEFTAEEAFKHGLPDIGAQAAGMVEDRKRLREVQAVERELLGLKVPQAKANLEQTESSTNANKGVGRYRNVWQFGETNPNKGRYAWIDPATGDAMTGPGGEVIAKAGQYTDKAPEVPNAWGRGGRGAGFGATPTEMGKVRDAFAALYRRGNTLDSMRDILEESIDTTGTLAATGNTGKIIAWTGRLANDVYNMMAASGMAGGFTALGKDGKEYSIDSPLGRQQLAKQYQSVIRKYLPPQFIETGHQAERWGSLVTELMYLEARSAEAGAKQFSDKDIEAMAEIIGAKLNDPNALADVILSSYDRAAADLEYSLMRYPPQVRDLIVDPEAQRTLEQQRAEVRARWEVPLIPSDATHEGAKPKTAPPTTESEEEFLNRTLGYAPSTPAQQASPLATGSRGPQRRR